MEYRTVIEIVSEADNSHDAADIAGEFLRGEIDAGVKMKCITQPSFARSVLYIGFFVAISISVICYHYTNTTQFSKVNELRDTSTSYAIHPPMKTSNILFSPEKN